MSTATPQLRPTLIWDWPTRVFHWALALSFAGAWLTAGSQHRLAVHLFCGYLMLGLVVFRVLWGFVGSHFSRFASFGFRPREALAYLREVASGKAARFVGHNPSGSVAIYLLLALALAIGVAGIITLGAQEYRGPAAGWFSFAQAHFFRELHEAAATLMLGLVGVHIAGVVVESVVHKENLARAMVDGHKLASADTPAGQAHTWVAAGMLLLILGFGGWWFSHAAHAPCDSRSGPRQHQLGGNPGRQGRFTPAKLADNAQWREECGSCHGVFQPALLPARSWQKLMAQQDQHFGTDLTLDAPTRTAVLQFMVDNAAEQQTSEAGFKIARSMAAQDTPLRITDTPYWVTKHRAFAAADWASPSIKSRANCGACHGDADAGTFDADAIRVPTKRLS
jgi:cytochrome b